AAGETDRRAGGYGRRGDRLHWRESREATQVVLDHELRVLGRAPGVAPRVGRRPAHLARGHLAVALVRVVLGCYEDVGDPRDPHPVGLIERAVELRGVG